MYVRITNSHFDPSRSGEVRALGPDLIAGLKGLPGCHDVAIGIDTATGLGVAVSYFDTEAHARFSRDALGDLIGRIGDAGIRMDPAQIYERLE